MEIEKIEKVKSDLINITKNSMNLSLVQNAGAAFEAVILVKQLRELLSDDIMKEVYMPLMNTKIGFLTDKPTKNNPTAKYNINEVRDCIIDAFSIGLVPTFNQFNIIAGRMYPTKEGYTALLKQIKCRYIISVGIETNTKPNFAELPVKISYDCKGDKNSYNIIAVVKKDNYSSYDQLKGKAERRAKKNLFEYITGLDFGENENDAYNEYTDLSNKEETRDPKTLFKNEGNA